jgi:AbrB family looped-hinge helix DNA binding protein
MGRSESDVAILTIDPYIKSMRVTITSKGQITIPLRLRRKFHLKVGNQLEFDDEAPVLTARRVVNRKAWEAAVADWQTGAAGALKGHPWERRSARRIVDDLRGGPADRTRP